MGFDWAADNYLSDALDKAERARDKAEGELASQKSGLQNILHTGAKSAVGMGVAGGLAYYAASSGSMMEPLKGLGIPVTLDALIGGLGKIAVLFSNKFKIPAEAVPYIDAAAQGALDHWAVVAGQRAGVAAKKASAPATKGVPQVSGAQRQPAQVSGPANPADYMTPAQKAVWEQYAQR